MKRFLILEASNSTISSVLLQEQKLAFTELFVYLDKNKNVVYF